jgi:hypothetical protein|nr:MAG TPA: hypothetical protein [Caudoviricetes sp.]
MDNIVYMFGIALLEHDGYCDFMDDSTQYKVVKWKLSDMNKYNGEYAVIGFDGSLKIYESEGKKIFDGSLLDSSDFCNKLREKI